MFQPVIPVVRDMYAHTFGEAIHLATIHAKYGGSHLEKALATTGETSRKDQKNADSGDTYMIYIGTPANNFDCLLNRVEVTYPYIKYYELPTTFLSIPVPPPEC